MNKVFLIGHLGRDPEMRTTQSGQTVVGFSLAVDRVGSKEKATDWFNVSVWGRVGEAVAQFCTKGKQVAVEGRIETRLWADKNGVERKTFEVVASSVEFLGSARDGADGGGSGGHGAGAGSGLGATSPSGYGGGSSATSGWSSGGTSGPPPNDAPPLVDDDIPF